jgi:CheY-like chemotaxis protein
MDAATSILAVDDDEAILEVVKMVLEDEGYRVLFAKDGAEALEVLKTSLPELILLDMRMPVMNGWQFADAYHKGPGPHAPIVVVTAAQDAPQAASDLRARDYLSKPFDVDRLVEVVRRHAPNGTT